jgi:hypothetical protein
MQDQSTVHPFPCFPFRHFISTFLVSRFETWDQEKRWHTVSPQISSLFLDTLFVSRFCHSVSRVSREGSHNFDFDSFIAYSHPLNWKSKIRGLTLLPYYLFCWTGPWNVLLFRDDSFWHFSRLQVHKTLLGELMILTTTGVNELSFFRVCEIENVVRYDICISASDFHDNISKSHWVISTGDLKQNAKKRERKWEESIYLRW